MRTVEVFGFLLVAHGEEVRDEEAFAGDGCIGEIHGARRLSKIRCRGKRLKIKKYSYAGDPSRRKLHGGVGIDWQANAGGQCPQSDL